MPDKNLLDYTIWEAGQTGSIGVFSQYGTRNRRVWAADPWGRQAVVWECWSVGVASQSGGIYVTPMAVDRTKMYRYAFWENRVVRGAASYPMYYLGLNGYGSTNGVYLRDTGGLSTNPYFWYIYSTSIPQNVWFLVVGHIWPAGSGIGDEHSDSGRWYTSGAKWGNITRDHVFHETTTTCRPRTLAMYHSETDGILHRTVYPRVDLCDGTEPTLAQLLKGWDSRLRRSRPMPSAYSFGA